MKRFVEGNPFDNLANAIILLAVKDYRGQSGSDV